MKKFLIGIVLGFLLFPLANDVIRTTSYYYPDNKTIDYLSSKMVLPNYGISFTLTKGCTKDVSKNGHGWVFIRRDFYKCGKISVFISDILFGEYTKPRDLELEKQACDGCSL